MAYETVAERIAARLREQILVGELAPGTPLSQVRVASSFGVSRIPVRDALQVLVAEGLVRPTTGATAVVTGMSVPELQELYEMREAIEPVATQIAVPNLGRAEVLQMRRLLGEMTQSDEPKTWLAANAHFHATVYQKANRPRMIQTVEQLRKLTDRYLHLHLEVIGNTEHLHAEHTRILEAVEAGDAALTASLTREHLATSHDFILQYLLEHAATEGTDPFASLHESNRLSSTPAAMARQDSHQEGNPQ
ncbi:MAG: GntR family transcriptional regulator [Microbacteriaceae bacterium]|jgi:DNA-binding GntR family transcriptional regulator|nr:GntR family transcriptional regulator [Microbacteriaceae bacterium]HEV7955604.1 GntR family transcriptional regulator [Marisediminicola sp.]